MSEINGNGTISTFGNIYLFPKEQPLTSDDVSGFIDYYENNIQTEMIKNRKYYTGQHPILEANASNSNAPDNRLVVNYPKYITDTFNGFFAGIPPKITLEDESDNEKLQDFIQSSSFFDHFFEVSKQASMYGRSYFFAYQDEDGVTQLVEYSPEQSFMIYDDDVARRPRAFVAFGRNKDNELTGTVYQADQVTDLEFNVIAGQVNQFKLVPAAEFYDNEERQGVFDNVETLIDSVNQTVSQKANDIDYFADSYLKLLGMDVDEETLENIRESRVINSDGEADVGFLEKPNADDTQEHHIDRLNNWIFEISMVSNITDDSFGNAASGKSLEYHLLSMRNLASTKERKFTQQLRKLFKVIFATGSILGTAKADAWQDLKFDFTRNLPSNITDEIDNFKNVGGTLSEETKLKLLPDLVEDPKAEVDKMNNETQALMPSAADYDFQKTDDQTQDES
ncbi:MAG: phage portal protein [Lactobacillus sp.]|nr:MAG: phage portal protein [Lactobacillus sp.]